MTSRVVSRIMRPVWDRADYFPDHLSNVSRRFARLRLSKSREGQPPQAVGMLLEVWNVIDFEVSALLWAELDGS